MQRVETLLFVILFLRSGAAFAEDWPHWRGLDRDSVVPTHSGFSDGEWLIREPLWRTELGIGSSSPVVVEGRVYCLGWHDDKDQLTCLSAEDGREIWRQSYESPQYGRHALGDQSFYSGPSSTPSFDRESGLLYTMSVDGELRCWDTQRGGELKWRQNLYDDFQVARRPRVGRSGHRDYGYTSSPLVLDDALIVEVGAATGTLIAFDKGTGKPLWFSKVNSPAGHNAGPVPMTVDGVSCVAVQTFEGLLVIRTDRGHEGETVATYPWKTDFANNIASVAVEGSDVLLTSAYNHHKIVKLHITLKGAEKVWEQRVASKVCTPVIYKGHVYWAWQQLFCLDFATGQEKWSGGRFGDPGSCVVTGDERLIVWSGQGDLTLAETAVRSPDAYRELDRRSGLGRAEAWPSIVVTDGKAFCKDRSGLLNCFNLSP